MILIETNLYFFLFLLSLDINVSLNFLVISLPFYLSFLIDFILDLFEFNIILLNVYIAVSQKSADLFHIKWFYYLITVSSCHRLRKSNKRFKLSYSHFIGMLLVQFFSLSNLFILFFQNFSTFFCKLRVNCSAEFDVGLNFFHFKIRIKSLIFESVHVDNVLCNLVIFIVIFFIKYQEKYIKSRHNWS